MSIRGYWWRFQQFLNHGSPRCVDSPLSIARRVRYGQPMLEVLEERAVPTCYAALQGYFDPPDGGIGALLAVGCDEAGTTITLDHSGSTTLVQINSMNWSFEDNQFDFVDVGTS